MLQDLIWYDFSLKLANIQMLEEKHFFSPPGY